MKQDNNKKLINFRLREGLIEALDRYSKSIGISRTDVIRQYLIKIKANLDRMSGDGALLLRENVAIYELRKSERRKQNNSVESDKRHFIRRKIDRDKIKKMLNHRVSSNV